MPGAYTRAADVNARRAACPLAKSRWTASSPCPQTSLPYSVSSQITREYPAPVTAHAPAPVTGKQLKNGLLPPSHFLPGYASLFADNSGGSLEHTTVFRISSMKCLAFWTFIGGTKGFGETAFADESAAAKSPSASVLEIFHQAVYQAASTKAAAIHLRSTSRPVSW